MTIASIHSPDESWKRHLHALQIVPLSSITRRCVAVFLVAWWLVSFDLARELARGEPCHGDLTQFVDPFIGSGGTGHTFPGATYPLGLIQLSPDTGIGSWDYCSGYQHGDAFVHGFSHTHLSGGGGADLGDILIIPFSDPAFLETEKAMVRKAEEVATPGFYSTFLADDQIRVELTATPRTGMHRYSFLASGNRNVLVSIDRILWSWGTAARGRTYDASFAVESDRRVSGQYRSKGRAERLVFFAIEFDQPFKDSRFHDEPSRKKLVFDFGAGQPETIAVRVAVSTVSQQSAWNNLAAESAGKSFDQLHDEAIDAWNVYLNKICIEATPEDKVAFYSSLYRLFIQPNDIADAEGWYRGADGKIHQSPSGHHYSTLALWDTYRAAHPLYCILDPAKNVEFVNSMLRHHSEAGYLPVWGFWGRDSKSMIGNHGVAVVAEAILKRLPGIDRDHAFEAIKDTLTRNHWYKYDWTIYDQYGFFPSDLVPIEPVSRSLEAAYDDWCAAQVAQALGRSVDRNFFIKRSQGFEKLFDRDTGFFRGRNSDQTWREPFDPMEVFHAGTSSGDYTEGNAWQYLWSVQQDVPRLIELLGGPDGASRKLDTLFRLPPTIYGKGNTKDVSGMIGQYAHGNEPSHHVIFLYNYLGRPQRTQELIRETLDTMYNATPDGHCGNDDYGQMSAWYILNCLGFYPVHPASGRYDLGIPRFKYARINLKERPLEIIARGHSPNHSHVQQVTLNGRILESPFVTYDEIMSGGKLVFELTPAP